MSQHLTLGYSPCPNDTYIFYALVHGKVTVPGITVGERLEDVETLNQLALAGTLPTLRQLQFFVALVRRQSFSRAATDCFVSQSTLSSAIKELEALLGQQLVDRSTRRFTLTPAGGEVAARAVTSLGLAEDLSRSLAARRPLEGPFHLGLIPTIAPFLLPKAAARLAREFPKLELYLREDLTASLVERLADGSLDAAVLALPYEAPGIAWIEFAEEPRSCSSPSRTARLSASSR